MKEFALRVESRIDALAQTHAAMAYHSGAALDLERFITEEAMLHIAHAGGQIRTMCAPSAKQNNKALAAFVARMSAAGRHDPHSGRHVIDLIA